jgi:hypothetical protein
MNWEAESTRDDWLPCQLVATPGHVRLVHAHAEPAAGEVRVVGDEAGRQDVRGSVLVKALRQPPQSLGGGRLAGARRVVEDPVSSLRILPLALTKHCGRFDRYDIAERLHSQFCGADVLCLEPGVKMSTRGLVRVERRRRDLVGEVEGRRAWCGPGRLGRLADLIVDVLPREPGTQ